jgi:tellurite resistance protein TerC
MDLTYLWIIFIFTVIFVFVLDFKLSILKPHIIGFIESLKLCFLWFSIASLYGLVIGYFLNTSKMIEYFTAYVIEYSLSIDNMFVFLMIFNYFNIEKHNQPKVLTIGIISAIFMRMIFIFLGIELVERFKWIIYIFGIILIYSGIKMFRKKEEEFSPDDSLIMKYFGKVFPFDKSYKGNKFFIRKDGKILTTRMLLVLVFIETSDIIFAIDSVPAVLAITHDRLIAYTSNIFAVVGLRSLYFALSFLADYFTYLKNGVSIILIYVGLKMIFLEFIHINPFYSLIFIISVLFISIVFSLIKKKFDFVKFYDII